MSEITVVHHPLEVELLEMGVFDWPVWEKEVSEFPWSYEMTETCYMIEGKVEVTPTGGDPVTFGAGDMVTFPAGMSCGWKITEAVRKHYSFS